MRNRHDRSHGSLHGGSRRLLPILAFVAAAALSIQCDAKLSEFFRLIGEPVPGTGDIFGRVTVDGTARSGVAVTLRRNGLIVDSALTDGSGNYEFLDLEPGTYTVSVTPPTGTTCPGEQTATVVEDDETQVNFACTTVPAQTGTVTGQVTVGGSPRSNVTVELRQGTTIVDTELTNASGNFTFPNVTTGTYTVRIVRPANTTCDGTVLNGSNEKPATVTANQTTTVNFACTAVSTVPTGTDIQSGWSGTRTRTNTTGSCPAALPATWTGSATFDVNHVIGLVNWDTQVTPISGNDNVLPNFTGTGSVVLGNGFEVTSDVAGVFSFDQSGTLVFSGTLVRRHRFPAGGTLVCEEFYNQTGIKSTPSSRLFKGDVVSLLPDGATLLGLRPVAFRYRTPYGDPAIPQVGLIAEEVVRVFPAAVTLGADGRVFGIQYGTLTGLLIGEVEARARRSMEAGIARLAEALE